MNILIYNGRYQYNVVRHFVDICINVLKNRNYNVIIIDETIEKNRKTKIKGNWQVPL